MSVTDHESAPPAVDATGTRAGLCYSPRWCQERAGHDGPHRKYLLRHKTKVHGMNLANGQPALVGLVRQGESSRLSGIVLILEGVEVAVPWALARRIANAILDEASTIDENTGILEET